MAIIWFSKLRDSMLWHVKGHLTKNEGFILELSLVSLGKELVPTIVVFLTEERNYYKIY